MKKSYPRVIPPYFLSKKLSSFMLRNVEFCVVRRVLPVVRAVRILRVFPTGAGRVGQRECERSVASVSGCEYSRLINPPVMP